MAFASFKGYDSIFAVRLRELIEEKNISKQTLSKEIGTSRQAISQYCDGSTIPNADKLTDIAEYFGVSLDYLAGITRERTTDTNIKAICEYTGLSEKAVDILHNLYDESLYTQPPLFDIEQVSTLSVISSFFENENEVFFEKISAFVNMSNNQLRFLSSRFNSPPTKYEDMKLSYLYMQVMDTLKEVLNSIVPEYKEYEKYKSEKKVYFNE